MFSYREFEAGPDPFGRKFRVFLKWLQTAISIRHADTVDVRFVLTDEYGAGTEKTIALPHADRQLFRVVGAEIGEPRSAQRVVDERAPLANRKRRSQQRKLHISLKRHAAELAKLEGAAAGARH